MRRFWSFLAADKASNGHAESDERRRSLCPSCRSVRGNAFMNAATATTTTLSYRCPACSAEWTVTKASQPISGDLQTTSAS